MNAKPSEFLSTATYILLEKIGNPLWTTQLTIKSVSGIISIYRTNILYHGLVGVRFLSFGLATLAPTLDTFGILRYFLIWRGYFTISVLTQKHNYTWRCCNNPRIQKLPSNTFLELASSITLLPTLVLFPIRMSKI